MPVTLQQEYALSHELHQEPLVAILEDFVTPQEVDSLVGAAESQLQRAYVSSDKQGVTSAGRTGSNCWIKHHHNPVISGLSQRVSALVGIPLVNAESLQVIHYGEAQEYAAHYDAWTPDTERGQRCMTRGGQRLVTCLLYLNDVQGGGGTGFPNLKLTVAARKGRLLVFHNCYPDTNQRHPDSLHGGLPVEQGEKWACNFWFREAPYQRAQPAPAKRAPKKSKNATRFKRRR